MNCLQATPRPEWPTTRYMVQDNSWCGRDRLPQGDDNNRMIAPDSQWGLADGLLNSPNRFLAVDGIDADQACCECGGGVVAPEV